MEDLRGLLKLAETSTWVPKWAHLWSRATLHLALDLPGKIWAAILVTQDIVTMGVDIFGVEEKTVHVEQTGAYFRKSKALRLTRISQSETWVHVLRICHYHDCGVEAEARCSNE